MNQNFKLIIGLGNPDRKYANTYHNVGFLFIDYLNNDPNLQIHPNLQIIKSTEFVNRSGIFIAKALKQYNTKPNELLIIHDDSDIELGKYKLSFERGAAGHHGVESVIAALKTKDFWRLRIGVRPAKEKIRQKAEKFVLKKITAGDKKVLEGVFGQISEDLMK